MHAVQVLNKRRHQRTKFCLSVRPRQPQKSSDNQKYWCSCPTDNHKAVVKFTFVRDYLTVPSRDNQNLGQTTRKCYLVACVTTIYFFVNLNTGRHHVFPTNGIFLQMVMWVVNGETHFQKSGIIPPNFAF